MTRLFVALLAATTLLGTMSARVEDAKLMANTPAKKYFAHPVVEDRNGVIAPWYSGLNGQCDFRVRIAAETLKRYPWIERSWDEGLTGWRVGGEGSAAAILIGGDTWSVMPPDGKQVVFPEQEMHQTFRTTPGKTYAVSFLTAQYVSPQVSPSASETYTLAYGIGGKNCYQDSHTYTVGGWKPWTEKTFRFTASSDSTRLSFLSNVPSGVGSYGCAVDKVSVVQVADATESPAGANLIKNPSFETPDVSNVKPVKLIRYSQPQPQPVMAAPHCIFNGWWAITPDGTITPEPKMQEWPNGDLGQRSFSTLHGMTEYYRYSGDPAALGLIKLNADYLLDYCQTSAEHPWPRFLISCPNKGKLYGKADPLGFIQLDVAAWVGSGLVEAYKLTGNPRYREAVERWADLLAEHCNLTPGAQPWKRYANRLEDFRWLNKNRGWAWLTDPYYAEKVTGGVCLINRFLDDVIRLGHRGKDDCVVHARDAGDYYLREVLLPKWTNDITWGCHFWDGHAPFTSCTMCSRTAEYLMSRPQAFPSWKTDVRNIVSLMFCRTGVYTDSDSGVRSGTWAIAESFTCCGKSLQYPTMMIGATLARFAAVAGDAWAKEVSRREGILTTYDAHENGMVEDLIDGGTFIAATWFNLTHPWPLWTMLEYLAWQPELMGANRENHIMRTSSVVRQVTYGCGRIVYTTYDAPAPSEDVLRLAFVPTKVIADGKPLAKQQTLSANGYSVKLLSNGDCILTVRHDGSRNISVEGDDPQQEVDADKLQYAGAWSARKAADKTVYVASAAGAAASFDFEGNQVRLIGTAGPDGGQADVYLDGVKQLCGIDFWCPEARQRQVLCYKNGLAPGKHTLKIVARGTKNPYATDANVVIDGLQWSDATGSSGYGEGEGPTDAQRVVFGYTNRKDYVDSEGHAWRPATEFVLRIKQGADLVPLALWTAPRVKEIANTKDPELYRYGVFGPDFTAYFTVKPAASYHVRIKLCQTTAPKTPGGYATSIDIGGKTVVTDMDIAATAGGLGKAVDLAFNDVRPKNGVIAVRFRHSRSGQAICQAIEVGPGRAEPGAKPVQFQFSTQSPNQAANLSQERSP